MLAALAAELLEVPAAQPLEVLAALAAELLYELDPQAAQALEELAAQAANRQWLEDCLAQKVASACVGKSASLAGLGQHLLTLPATFLGVWTFNITGNLLCSVIDTWRFAV